MSRDPDVQRAAITKSMKACRSSQPSGAHPATPGTHPSSRPSRPSSRPSKPDTSSGPPPARNEMVGMACDVSYRAFRLVVVARTAFYFAAGIFASAALYFIESYIAAPPQGEELLGTGLIISVRESHTH
jgi:hypothetical protein